MSMSISMEAEPYWEGLTEQKLMLQKCDGCGLIRHYPRPMCPTCHSMDTSWVQASGKGVVYSWTITHQTSIPAFKERVPYVLATVDLNEGVRMLAPLVSVDPKRMRPGMLVNVGFETLADSTVIPILTEAASQ